MPMILRIIQFEILEALDFNFFGTVALLGHLLLCSKKKGKTAEKWCTLYIH